MKVVYGILGLTAFTGFLLWTNRKTQKINFPLYVSASSIHGQGLFTSVFIPTGSPIYTAIETILGPPYFFITPFATKMNHSLTPNSKIIFTGDVYTQFATKDILPGEEITSDYRYAPEFINRNIQGFRP